MLRAVTDAHVQRTILEVLCALFRVTHALLDVFRQEAQITQHSDADPVSLDAAARLAEIRKLLAAQVHQSIDLDLGSFQVVLRESVNRKCLYSELFAPEHDVLEISQAIFVALVLLLFLLRRKSPITIHNYRDARRNLALPQDLDEEPIVPRDVHLIVARFDFLR